MARYQTVLRNNVTGEQVVIRSNDHVTFQARILKKQKAWAKEREKVNARIQKENALAEADTRTQEALQAIEHLRAILPAGISSSAGFDWNAYWKSQVDTSTFESYKPSPSPLRGTYFTNVPRKSFWELLYPPKKRYRESLEQIAQSHFDRACRSHDDKENEQREAHERERHTFLARKTAHNDKTSRSRKSFEEGTSSAVEEYLRTLLDRSEYPEGIDLDYEVRFIPPRKWVALDVELPPPACIPTLSEVRYVKSREEFAEKHLKRTEIRGLYNEAIAQIVVRVIHEVFRVLYTDCAHTLSFNGTVAAVDPRTGQPSRTCIVAVRVERSKFSSFNLSRINAQQCLLGLGAVVGGEFCDLAPVAPIPMPEKEGPSPTDNGLDSNAAYPTWRSIADGAESVRSAPAAASSRPGVRSEPPAGVRPRFVGRGSAVIAGGFKLIDPLIYVADCDSLPDADASLVCLRRRIEPPRADPPKSLGYWPQLSELQPHQVGNYLQWLSGGRSSPDIELGYVFLYFYGLERRALVEGEDALPIAEETVRLIGVYGGSRSFRSYAIGLVSHLIMLGRVNPTWELLSRLLVASEDFVEGELQAVFLGHLGREKTPLPADWAMRLASQDERAKRSVVTQKATEEVSKLFSVKYQERFKNGIVPAPGSREELIQYRAASPSLLSGTRAASSIPVAKWLGIPSWRKQFNPVVDLWNDCLDELKQYARKVGTAGRDSADAFEALPGALRDPDSHPLKSAWDTLLAEFSPDEGVVLLPVSRLATLRGIEPKAKLTLAQSRDLADLAEILGTPLEPDARFLGRPYLWDSHVAALRLPEEPCGPSGKAYHTAGMILHLAAEIARADGQVDENERRTTIAFITEHFQLGWNDSIRLNGLFACILRDEPSLQGIKQAFSYHLDKSQKLTICQFLISVAAASNGVSAEEIAALRRIYKALDLDPGLVDQHLVELGHVSPESPTLVSKGSESPGEIIPPPFPLNLERIRQLRAESDEVAKMLVTAMTAEGFTEDEGEEAGVATPNGGPSPALAAALSPGKDSRTSPSGGPMALISDLLRRPTWPLADFAGLARKHGQSAAAAVEIINEWSEEHLGDFLIEEGDPLVVHIDLWQRAGKTT